MREIPVAHSQVNKKETAVHVPTVSSASLSIVILHKARWGSYPEVGDISIRTAVEYQ
jgi:hypothetical protein